MTYQSRGTITCILCGQREAIGRKLCRPCYLTARTNGTLEQFPRLGPQDVFESRIKKTESCWLWRGNKNSYGYGIFSLPGGKCVRAHRYSYEFFTGRRIPDGMVIMHTCDNPPCVNPAHLRMGTKAENNMDAARKERHNYGTAHWNGRLTTKEVEEIRASAEPRSLLAARYGVVYSHIWRIQQGTHRRVR